MVRRIVFPAVMVVVVCLLFWAGWHNLRARRLEMQQKQQAQITVTKGGDDAAPDGPKLDGKPAPAFTLLDMTGKKVSLADYKGRPVVVNFWATWCGPCQLEMPWFEEFHTKYKDKGLEILGVSDDAQQEKDEILKVAKKRGVTYPLLFPNDKIVKDYGGIDYYPETFYIDKTGTIVAITVGDPTKDEMEADIRKAIGAGV